MAVRWEWKEKVGELDFDGLTVNLYEGNCFLIGIKEFKNADGVDVYNVMWFFADKQHAKRCLGLEKGSYDMFEGNVDHITIYMDKCRNWKDILALFGKTQKNIVMTVKPTKEVAE